jgi:hypothetical protein
VKKALTITLLIAFMLMLYGSGWGDELINNKVTKGFKGGVVCSQLGGGIHSDGKLRAGFLIGGFIGFPFLNDFTIQPELYYIVKGSSNYDFKYLELPVLLKYDIPTAGSVIPSTFFGPSIALRLSSRVKFGNSKVYEKIDIKDIDFGLFIGGGFYFKAGPGKVCFDARYSIGLTNLKKGADFSKFNLVAETNCINEAFIFSIGYSL